MKTASKDVWGLLDTHITENKTKATIKQPKLDQYISLKFILILIVRISSYFQNYYFVNFGKHEKKGNMCCTTIRLEFLIYNMFFEQLFQQIIPVIMGTSTISLFVNCFLTTMRQDLYKNIVFKEVKPLISHCV